jgi:hypothetical protein
VQWQISTDGGATWNNIPGATSTTLSFTVQLSDNGNQYHAVFTNGCGTATCSTVVTVRPVPKVNRPPVIEIENEIVDVPCGETVALRVKATDPDGDIVSLKWSAACGTVLVTDNAVTFSAGGGRAGRCGVNVTGDDGNGGITSKTVTAKVGATTITQTATVAFNAAPTSGNAPLTRFHPSREHLRRTDRCGRYASHAASASVQHSLPLWRIVSLRGAQLRVESGVIGGDKISQSVNDQPLLPSPVSLS